MTPRSSGWTTAHSIMHPLRRSAVTLRQTSALMPCLLVLRSTLTWAGVTLDTRSLCPCNMAPQTLALRGSTSTAAKCLPLTLRATFLHFSAAHCTDRAHRFTSFTAWSEPCLTALQHKFTRLITASSRGIWQQTAAAAETASLFGCVVFKGNVHECLL